jgi:ribonuclease BN (tRNA processing enzyme)
MEVTLLGTGSPVPLASRAGTSVHVSVGAESLLLDCGPGTVHRLVENRIHPGAVDRLLFTHHHVDHNADFNYFVITNWARGEGLLEIHGPRPGTEALLESLCEVYEEDLRYRERVNDFSTSVADIPCHDVSDGTEITTDRLRIEACAVEHSIETYAYRLTDTETGGEVVFSGDTRKIDRLGEFAEGADVLIQDCCIAPVSDSPPAADAGLVWESYTEPLPDKKWERLREVHCTPTEAGELAAAGPVDRLVLTHLLPYRDEATIEDRASAVFDGEVLVAHDGLSFEV